MINDYLYVFECDYGHRIKEKQFIKDILNSFDKDYATMVGVMVNNNPYCLSFNVAVNLQKDPIPFENWLKNKYPEKMRRHNVFTKDLMHYNIVTFLDEDMVDLFISEQGNSHPFLWPERELLEKNHSQYAGLQKKQSKVFISHSSRDKPLIVNTLNSYLQANEIATWYDSFDIDYGDNILIKVNEGIEKSDVGLFVLTDNFFDSRSGWPVTEFSAFFMSLMNTKKKILMIDAGVTEGKIMDIMKAYRYIQWEGGRALPEIANAINKMLAK